MSKDKPLSLKDDPELEFSIHSILDKDLATIEKEDPELYEALTKNPNFNRLKRATGKERSNLTKWLLDAGIRKVFKGK